MKNKKKFTTTLNEVVVRKALIKTGIKYAVSKNGVIMPIQEVTAYNKEL